MNYVISNEYLRVEISSFGAELQSVKSLKTGREYLWQGDEKFWSGRAPIMFPVCGRMLDGKYTFNGNGYVMPCHGFAKSSHFSITEQKEDSISLTLKADTETKKCYPFDFTFTVTFALSKATLKTTFTITNDVDEETYFSFGGHPAFNVPFIEGESFDDYFIEFSQPMQATQAVFSDRGLFTGKTLPVDLVDGKILNLTHQLFAEEAIFINNPSPIATIKSKKSNGQIKVSYEGFPYVGLWQTNKGKAPYLCVEPWYGFPSMDGVVEDLTEKAYMVKIRKGEKYQKSFDIEITE